MRTPTNHYNMSKTAKRAILATPFARRPEYKKQLIDAELVRAETDKNGLRDHFKSKKEKSTSLGEV